MEKDLYDIAIVGGGPAGMTAAIYAAKAEKMVSLLMGDVVEPRKNYMYKYAEF